MFINLGLYFYLLANIPGNNIKKVHLIDIIDENEVGLVNNVKKFFNKMQ